MMVGFKYIRNNLLKEETLVYALRPHWVIFSWSIWLLVFAFYMVLYAPAVFNSLHVIKNFPLNSMIALLLLIISAYSFLSALIYYKCAEYGITNKRVLIKTGLIRRESLEIMLEKVEGVMVDQTIMGRVFCYGQITIIGTGGTKDSFPYIPNPLEFRRQVQQQIDSYEAQFRNPPAMRE